MTEPTHDFIASRVTVRDGLIELDLNDGSRHAFPIHYYPRLRHAGNSVLSEVTLRVGGRALRWESLDEDIWIADAIYQNYPKQPTNAVAEDPN